MLSGDVPVLGICYGMHALAAQLGGEVATSDKREFGHARIESLSGDLLAGALNGASDLDVWMSHGDKVVHVPDGFLVTACSDNAPIAAMEDPERRIYALQFHPEVTHTASGDRILARFALDICRLRAVVDAGQHRRRRHRAHT